MNLMLSPEKVKKVLHQETDYKQVKERTIEIQNSVTIPD